MRSIQSRGIRSSCPAPSSHRRKPSSTPRLMPCSSRPPLRKTRSWSVSGSASARTVVATPLVRTSTAQTSPAKIRRLRMHSQQGESPASASNEPAAEGARILVAGADPNNTFPALDGRRVPVGKRFLRRRNSRSAQASRRPGIPTRRFAVRASSEPLRRGAGIRVAGARYCEAAE